MKHYNDYDLSKAVEVFNYNAMVEAVLIDNYMYAKEIYGENMTANELADYLVLINDEGSELNHTIDEEHYNQIVFIANKVIVDKGD